MHEMQVISVFVDTSPVYVLQHISSNISVPFGASGFNNIPEAGNYGMDFLISAMLFLLFAVLVHE